MSPSTPCWALPEHWSASAAGCHWTSLSRELDGAFNEDYCKWCYHDGTFQYESKEQLIDFCVEHMATETWPKEQVRAHMEAVVPLLKHWK